VKLVQTTTISAVPTVTLGATTLQYLVNPQIHYDLTGTPTTIIGDASNEKGEFCIAKIDQKSIHLFLYITAKNDFDSLLVHGDDIPQELLGETNDLKSFSNPLVATLVPNFMAINYGQKSPMETILTMKSKQNCFIWGPVMTSVDKSWKKPCPTIV
jgi:hypothetical protein